MPGEFADRTHIFLITAADDHESRRLATLDLCECAQEQLQSLFYVQSREKKQHALIGLPAELRAGGFVVGFGVARHSERERFDTLAGEEFFEPFGFQAAGREQCRGAREEPLFDEVKVGPFFPPFVLHCPRLQHAVWRDDIRDAELRAAFREAHIPELPEAVEVDEVFAFCVFRKRFIDGGSGANERGAQAVDRGVEPADALCGRRGEEVDVHDFASR